MVEQGIQVSTMPVNFEYVSSHRRIPDNVAFCPVTITGNGTGNLYSRGII